MKIDVAAEAALRKNDRQTDKQDETQSLPPKLVEKLVWVPVISLCTIFIPSYTGFDALVC